MVYGLSWYIVYISV